MSNPKLRQAVFFQLRLCRGAYSSGSSRQFVFSPRRSLWSKAGQSPSPFPFLNTSSFAALQIRSFKSAAALRLAETSQQSTPPPASDSPNHQPKPPKRRYFRSLLIVLLISIPSLAAGIAMSASPIVQTALAVRSSPSDVETLSLWNPDVQTPTGQIESALLSHPLTRALESDPRFTASRPHLKIPPGNRPKSFTGGQLIAPGKIVVPPLVFSTGDGMELVSICYLGDAVCGHPGIVHGGLLATLMDEGLARTCFAALPHKVGMTASLKIDYRAPCKADQFVVLKAKTTKVEGRKAWVKGQLETLPLDGSPGKVLVEGEALFVEPKGIVTQLMRIAS